MPIKDKESEDGSEDGSEEDGQVERNKLKATVDEADVLSDLGTNKSKDQAAKRITKMATLLKTLKHDLSKDSCGPRGTAHAKSVQTSLDSLRKWVNLKQGNKDNMEAAKNELLEAALVV